MRRCPRFRTCLDSLRVARPRGGRLIDELAEPELEHDELPQAVAVVGASVAVVGPQARDFAVVENAAVAQAAVGEERLRHRRERPAQPFADRRGEALLAALEDL